LTTDIAILFSLLVVMVYLFLTERIPVDLTAFAGLVILVVVGFVKPEDAFLGFSSPAVITMLSVFFISAGLLHTGVADMMGRRIHALVGGREVPLVVLIMVTAGVLSAFMNNIAATAVLLPAVASLARQAAVAPSRLMIPLAFGAILGGTTTLVGTPPNILAAEVLASKGLEPFGLFAYTPIGLVLLAAGVLYMITLGRRLLPDRGDGIASAGPSNLSDVYRLEESMIAVRVPSGSALEGLSLKQAQLGAALRIQVLSIVRAGEERLSPEPDEVIRAGDRLVVQGRHTELEQRLRMKGIQVEAMDAVDLEKTTGQVDGVVIRLEEGSSLAGKTPRQLRFREQFGAVVVAVWREGSLLFDRGEDQHPLLAGDEILLLGPEDTIQEIAKRPDCTLLTQGPKALRRLEQNLFLARVPEGSPLAGSTVAASRIGEFAGLTVIGAIREGGTHLSVSPDEPIEEGDRLLVTGKPGRIHSLLKAGQIEVKGKAPMPTLETDHLAIAEVVVAPRASLAGKTMTELKFRERYGFRVLAIWSGGGPVRSGLALRPLATGDGLLLQGPPEKIPLLATDPDFVLLSPTDPTPRRTRKAPFALAGLALMVVLVLTGAFPIQVASFAGAVFVVLTGAITMREAYRAVEWRAIFLVAAILPVGIAMESTGAAKLLADTVVDTAGAVGPYAVLGMLIVLSSLLSQGLDGAPTVVLLAPVVLTAAAKLEMSPYPLMMGVGVAASAAFMTPFSHKANLLVMGAGGYRSMDYIKVGTPLTLVVYVLLIFLVPLMFGF
jgi:di/tricarboxylate transporter